MVWEKHLSVVQTLRLSFMLSDVIEASVYDLLGKEVWVFERLSSCHKS